MDTLWQQVLLLTNGTNQRRSFFSANSTEICMMRRFMLEHKRQVVLFHVYASEPFVGSN